MERRSIAVGLSAAVLLAGCSGLGNTISGAFGGTGMARLIVASPTTAQNNITLMADRGIINSALGGGARTGVYAKVNAGSVAFDINTGVGTSDLVHAINVNVAASTNYSVVLEGEPGAADYQAFAFQDTNGLNSPATVRFKVNNAAPNLATPVDVYIWPASRGIPGIATVPGLALNQDSGSSASHPGNAYIPQQGSTTTLPAGTYDIAIAAAGVVPNGLTDLFDGSTPLNVNVSYSFTIEDKSATQNDVNVILSIDEPFQSSNQAIVTHHAIAAGRS